MIQDNEDRIYNNALDEVRPQVEAEAAAIELPDDLRLQVVAALNRCPEIPWDFAVADIARQLLRRGEAT